MVITESGTSVLLVHSPGVVPEACTSHEATGESLARLTVTFDTADLVETPEGTDIVGVIGVGKTIEPATVPRPASFDGTVSVETVAEPADLSSVGVKVSSFCEQWGSEHVDLVVCIHSLERIIDATSQQTAFEFMRLLNERLRQANAAAHVHLDPSATDGPTVETFEPLFDEVEVAGLGATPPSEREDSSAPRFGRSTATDSEIARKFDDDGTEAAGPTTPDRPASDSEIADRLGDEESASSATPTQPDTPASDDEIASSLGAEAEESVERGRAPASTASDDEIADRLENASDPEDMDTDELLEVDIDDGDVSDDEIEDQLEEWRD